MRKNLLLPLIILIISLIVAAGGCGGGQPGLGEPTPTAGVTGSPTPVLAPTRTPTLGPAPTPTPIPTLTPIPTATPAPTATPVNKQMVSDAQTIALWHFNETTGQIVYDHSGHVLNLYLGDDGTLEPNIEPARLSSGRDGFGYCLSFDATKHQHILHAPSLSFKGIRSIEFWIKANPVSEQRIIALIGPLVLKHSAAGEIYFGFWDTSGTSPVVRYCSSYSEIDDGQWHYVACTFDTAQNDSKIYFDGVYVAGNMYTTSILKTDAQYCYVGGYSASPYYTGLIDECRVSDCVRTAAEILAYYNRAKDTIHFP